MKVLSLVLSSVLAVSAFGLVLLRHPEPTPDVQSVSEPQPVVPETEFQTLEVPVPQAKTLEAASKPVEVPAIAEPIEELAVAEPIDVPVEIKEVEASTEPPVFKPAQTLEERGDAMLFEAQAMLDTPFDQAITMPFDNL